MWDVKDVGWLGYGMFWDVGWWGCGMLEMWDVEDVGCSGCGMLGMWDVRNVECLGCGMFKMWNVRDVGFLSKCGMLICKMRIDTNCLRSAKYDSNHLLGNPRIP